MKRKTSKITSVFFTIFALVLLVIPLHNISATNYVPLSDLPNMPAINPEDVNSLGVYIGYLIPLFIGICAVLAVVMIVVGGMQYMTSELISSKEAGKSKIKNALTGLLLALSAWLLLYTINPNILSLDFSKVKGTGEALSP